MCRSWFSKAVCLAHLYKLYQLEYNVIADDTSNGVFDLKEKQTHGSRLPVLHCWVSTVTAGMAAAA